MQRYGASGTIYDAPPARTFNFKSTDPDLNEQLGGGFQAAHVTVTNPTNQYLWIEDGKAIVAPGTFGKTIPLSRTDVARASWTIPAIYGITQPVPTGGAAILIFVNEGVDISPDPGVSDGRVQLPWQLVGSKVTVGLGADNFTTGIVAAGAITLGLAIPPNGSLGTISVVGKQSGVVYEFGSTPQSNGWYTVPINGALDNQYVISWLTTLGVGQKISAYVTGLSMGFPTLGGALSTESLPVAIAFDQFPLGIANSDYDVVGVSTSAAGVAASVILAAAAGKTYHAAAIVAAMEVQTAGGGISTIQLLDGAASLMSSRSGVAAAVGSLDRLPLAGLAYKGTAGNSMTLNFAAGLAGAPQSVSIGAYLR